MIFGSELVIILLRVNNSVITQQLGELQVVKRAVKRFVNKLVREQNENNLDVAIRV